MSVPVYLGHDELIERFFFKEKASIKIPKEVREIAHSFQLDIEILSTRGNDYVNSKSIPAYGFYGYVVLVMRDHSEIQIPIAQPRQVLFRERIAEAYANWYSLYLKACDSFEKAFVSEFQLTPIAQALGLTAVSPFPSCFDWSGFKEIELREVYVKCPFGTRFKLEASYEYPNEVIYGECSYDGKSRRIDSPEKDNGLPSDGVQPPNNDNPSNPYAGFDPPSESSELGNWDNSNKLEDVDNVSGDNSLKRFLGVIYTALSAPPVCQRFAAQEWVEIPKGATASTQLIRSLSPVCGGQIVRVFRVVLLGSGTVLFPEVFALDGYSLSYVDAESSPPSSFVPI